MNEEVFDSLVSKWEGVPFVHGGRSINGVDCSFFIHGFLNDYFKSVGSSIVATGGFKLPSYIVDNYDKHFFMRLSGNGKSIIKDLCDTLPFLKERTNYQKYGWKILKKGDLLIFPQGKCPGAHCGIYCQKGVPGKSIEARYKIGVRKFSIQGWLPRYVYSVDYNYGL